jgi:hypothetical protein
MHKNASRLLAFAVFATLLVVPMWAQSPPANPLTCLSATACKINFIPIFSSNGGPATEKASLMHVTNGFVTVGGAITASKGGGVHNTISGSNTQANSLTTGAGVYGQLSTTGQSATGAAFQNGGGGVWGDGGKDANYAIIGTTDDKAAGIFQNNGPSFYTNFSFNFATGSTGFPWAAENGDGAGCNIDTVGDLTCSGSKNAAVPVEGGKRWVALGCVVCRRVSEKLV